MYLVCTRYWPSTFLTRQSVLSPQFVSLIMEPIRILPAVLDSGMTFVFRETLESFPIVCIFKYDHFS